MSLKEILTKVPPRELSGSTAPNRFDFQKDWIILRIFEIHDKRDDYCFLIEHFDDAVMIDSDASPRRISFFQIKSKDNGEWSFSRLFKPRKHGSGKSTIAKLLDHIEVFEEGIESLNFVSNARISNEMLNTSMAFNKNKFPLRIFNEETKANIKETLQTQTSIEIDDIIECTLCFITTSLPAFNHEEHVLGHIIKFVNKKFGQHKINAESLYKTLFEEIRLRTNRESRPESFHELCKLHGISKSEINKLLESYFNKDDWDAVWIEFSSHLREEGLPYGEIQNIKNSWRAIELRLITGSDTTIEGLQRTIRDIITEKKINKLSDFLSEVCNFITHETLSDEYFIKALSLRTLHEIQEHSRTT